MTSLPLTTTAISFDADDIDTDLHTPDEEVEYQDFDQLERETEEIDAYVTLRLYVRDTLQTPPHLFEGLSLDKFIKLFRFNDLTKNPQWCWSNECDCPHFNTQPTEWFNEYKTDLKRVYYLSFKGRVPWSHFVYTIWKLSTVV